MRWAKSEYMSKGVFLGLILYVAMQDLTWMATGRIALWLTGGLAFGLVLASFLQFKDIKGLGRNPIGFLLFLLLENPFAIYLGVIGGLAFGAVTENQVSDDPNSPTDSIIGFCVFGGAIFGYGLGELRETTRGYYRLGLSFGLCAAALVGVYFWLDSGNFLEDPTKASMLGVHLLLGIPFFYLLVFCGMAEESEVEIAALCATLGLALWLVKFPKNFPMAGLLVPIGLYTVYTFRILTPLRVFKHSLRGYGHYEVGRVKDALFSFNRALQLDPANALAKSGMVRLHRRVKLDGLDADTRALLNPNLCVAEASNLLLNNNPPSPQQRKEANDLLAFVSNQWPQMRSNTDYFRVVSDTHAKDFDSATDRLARLLDPTAWPAGDRFRKSILFDAWQLALRTHPELKRLVGDGQIGMPGRRVEALCAVERQLKATPDDAVADLRRELFTGLTESEYLQSATDALKVDFPFEYAEQEGIRLLDQPANRHRGAEVLRIVCAGMPTKGPVLLSRVSEAADKSGDAGEALRYRQMVRDVGRKVGAGQPRRRTKNRLFPGGEKTGRGRQPSQGMERGDLQLCPLHAIRRQRQGDAAVVGPMLRKRRPNHERVESPGKRVDYGGRRGFERSQRPLLLFGRSRGVENPGQRSAELFRREVLRQESQNDPRFRRSGIGRARLGVPFGEVGFGDGAEKPDRQPTDGPMPFAPRRTRRWFAIARRHPRNEVLRRRRTRCLGMDLAPNWGRCTSTDTTAPTWRSNA